MATTTIAPDLLQTDLLVLHNLLQNIRDDRRASPKDEIPLKSPDQTSTVALAESLPSSSSYEDEPTLSQLSLLKDRPTAFCTWDLDDHVFSTTKDPSSSPTALKNHILHRYVTFAQTIVRNPLDVVFLTHILLYLSTSVPSAILLYNNFTVLHAVLHWLMQSYYCGSFTLLLHNHIHNGGLFMRTPWLAVADYVWPYVLEPLMGHTWDSYYWHHVKHHHVENNGPGDLSSTIWYQRDEFTHFLIYLGRFMFLIWIELPAYFLKKRRYRDAIVVFAKEMGTYAAIVMLARWKFLPTLFVFIIPLIQMRIGLMVGNWGQHALVDEEDPESDFRSSITLIDVPVCNLFSTKLSLLVLSHLSFRSCHITQPFFSKSGSPLCTIVQPLLLQRRLAYLPPP